MLNTKSFLTVDFGAGSLKLAEFEVNEAGGLRLKQYGLKALGAEGAQESTREAVILKALQEILAEQGIKTRYLHSEINTIERTEIIRQLRLGKYDVLVGINLLREGLDIPEVGFVGILDADKEGFLRDARSLVQTIGRAARNVNAKVVLYADTMTDSIRKAITETERRRTMQLAYNARHGITPQTIRKPIREREVDITDIKHVPKSEIPNLIIELEADMREAAERLEFERAIALRDTIKKLQEGGAGEIRR